MAATMITSHAVRPRGAAEEELTTASSGKWKPHQEPPAAGMPPLLGLLDHLAAHAAEEAHQLVLLGLADLVLVQCLQHVAGQGVEVGVADGQSLVRVLHVLAGVLLRPA